MSDPRAHVNDRHAHVGESSTVRDEAILALTTLGWKSPTARHAVDRALDELDSTMQLEPLIRAALRNCAAS